MTQNATMINVNDIVQAFKKERTELREDLKKKVQEWIDNEELDYYGALQIFEASHYFDIRDYVISDGTVFDMFDEDVSEYMDRGRTVYFTEIIEWIDGSEGEVVEACDAAGVDPYKEIYDYAVEHDVIGYNYDW